MAEQTAHRKRVALVIGAGSVKCAAALGLQKALQEAGISLDMVVGCSGGSIYATLIAMGYDAATMQEMTLRLWTKDVTKRPDRMALLRAFFPRLFGFNERFALRDDVLIQERFREVFGERTFADARIPLFLTATDFHNGEQVILSEGRLSDANRASIAIPFTFPPWPVDGRLLIDGFMSDPMPIGVAIREGADVIIAMGFESPYQERVNTAARFAFQMSSIMTNNLLKANFAFHNLAHHAEMLLVIPEFSQRIRLFDTDKIPYIIEEGERAMCAQIEYLKSLLKSSSNESEQLEVSS